MNISTNKNYLDFELTELLPIKNPYSGSTYIWVFNRSLDVNQMFCESDFTNYTFQDFVGSYSLIGRDAWTWEDVRLYLESHGWYIPTIKKHYIEHPDKTVTRFTFVCEYLYAHSEGYDLYDSEKEDAYCMTYNTARYNAIKWCLNKISKES